MSLTRHKPFIEIVFLIMLFLLMHASGVFAANRMDGWTLPRFGTTERFAVDGLSGVALRGFDPVAYFAVQEARPGHAAYEAFWGGVGWRFVSEANRAAFLRDPEVYQPRFGGYDAEAAARGLTVEADPTIFALSDGRLYVFRTREARERFLADANVAKRADRAWTALERSLAN